MLTQTGVEATIAILDAVGDGVVAANAAGRVVYCNDAATRLLGAGAAALYRDDWADGLGLFQPDGVTRVAPDAHPLACACRGDAMDDVELLLRTDTLPQGVLVSVTGRGASGAGEGGVAGVIVLRDVSRRSDADRELLRLNAFLDSVVENIPDMIFVKEAGQLRFERFNRAGEELLGLPRSALIGKNDYDFFPADQADFFTGKDREVLAQGTLVDILEEPISTAHGERWLHTKKIPILDEHGHPKYLLGISQDITKERELAHALREAHDQLERRVLERTAALGQANSELRREIEERERAEAALARTEEQLRHAQKMEAIGRLAGGVAHDFNNLLSIILSCATLGSRRLSTDHAARGDFEEIEKAAQRAADLTRQLLAFSRQRVMEPRVYQPNEALAELLPLLSRLLGEDVELVTVAAPALWKVKADPGQIEQIVINLAVNARDAMPAGGRLVIETANVELDEAYAKDHLGVTPGPHVKLTVSDSGMGMDRATLARIFEPFFTTKERGKGTGLGLSIVFGIVQQCGGTIWAYSEAGVGTTIEIYVPRATEQGEAISSDATRTPPRAGSETILLVEDEQQLRHVVHRILVQAGYRVLEAESAADAIELCEAHGGEVQLLLTDVVMPAMNGRQLADRLLASRPGLRLLFVSGHTGDVVVHHGVLDAGVAFLQKPISPDELLRKVRAVLDARR